MAHREGISVSGASVLDGIPTDRDLLVIEGKGHKGVPPDPGLGRVRFSKAMGVDEELNVHQP